jgi:hypothetical protein
MVNCAYCERPLICESCRTPYAPPTADDYESLSRPEVAVICPGCETILVCHWCKTPYDGSTGDEPAAETDVPSR